MPRSRIFVFCLYMFANLVSTLMRYIQQARRKKKTSQVSYILLLLTDFAMAEGAEDGIKLFLP
jgi:hypothetical protein